MVRNFVDEFIFAQTGLSLKAIHQPPMNKMEQNNLGRVEQ